MEETVNIELKKLQEYKLSKKLSSYAWNVLTSMDNEQRELLGIPFVKAIDAVGANITDGFNQIDTDARITSYINSKAALSEGVNHWAELMLKRNVISKITYTAIKNIETPLRLKLQKYILTKIKNEK